MRIIIPDIHSQRAAARVETACEEPMGCAMSILTILACPFICLFSICAGRWEDDCKEAGVK